MPLETMAHALRRLHEVGFTDDLVADDDGGLRSVATGDRLDPGTLLAVEIVRFEGASDPDDEAVVVAVASRDGVPLGTFTSPYGPGASAAEARVLEHLHRTVASPTDLAEPHDAHDHVLAVFGDRAGAEAAVADLREIGLGSEHLGIAVHGGDRVVFERDEERDVERDAAVGVGTGAVVGFTAGMLLFALAVPGIGTLGAGGVVAMGAGSVLGGSMLGGVAGIAVAGEEYDSHALLRDVPLGADEVLVVACGHHHADRVRAAMVRHGGRIVSVV